MIESGLSCKCVGGDASWCYDTPLFPLFRTYTLLQAPTIGIEDIARLIRLTEHLLDRGLKLPRLVVVGSRSCIATSFREIGEDAGRRKWIGYHV